MTNQPRDEIHKIFTVYSFTTLVMSDHFTDTHLGHGAVSDYGEFRIQLGHSLGWQK